MSPKKILCPIDFSPCSEAALAQAIELAKLHGANLLLANVAAPPPTFGSGYSGYGELPIYRPEPDRRLDALQIDDSGISVERYHLVGVEGETIVEFAEEVAADLIVMGTHGYGSFMKFFLGSVAEYVLRNAKPRVIVVRESQKAAKSTNSDRGAEESGNRTLNADVKHGCDDLVRGTTANNVTGN